MRTGEFDLADRGEPHKNAFETDKIKSYNRCINIGLSTDTVYICVRLSLRRLTVQLYFRRYYSWETFSWFESAESLGWLAGLLGKYRRQELRVFDRWVYHQEGNENCVLHGHMDHGEEPDCNCPSSASTHSAAWVVSPLANVTAPLGDRFWDRNGVCTTAEGHRC